MLRCALFFLVLALIAAVLDFGGVAHYSWEGAQVLFFLFLVFAVLSFLSGAVRRSTRGTATATRWSSQDEPVAKL
jgi:uncharacterized membrane protein YtjA (UPF0391 family)